MEITVVILISEKARLAADAAQNNVKRVIGEKNAGAARHGQWLGSENEMSLAPLAIKRLAACAAMGLFTRLTRAD